MKDSACVSVFSATRLNWDPIFVTEVGVDQKDAIDHFKRKDQRFPSLSKIVQVSHNQIILVGGWKDSGNLLTREYNVERSCLLVDLSSGIVAEKSQMTHGRYDHAVATIGKYVYAVAGQNQKDGGAERTCERYDI